MASELSWAEALSNAGDFQSHHIESTPNGQSYGKEGHIPCDHVAVFDYTRATIRLANLHDRMVITKEMK